MSLWAEDKEVVDIEDLTKPIVDAIQSAIELGPDAIKDGVPWTGPRLLSKMFRAVAPQPEAQLFPEQLEYHAKNGRGVLEVIAMIAVQLGIEQGLKMYEETYLEPEIMIRKLKEREENG